MGRRVQWVVSSLGGEVALIEEEDAQARRLPRKGMEVLAGAMGTCCCVPV